jgi:hypothetical protein
MQFRYPRILAHEIPPQYAFADFHHAHAVLVQSSIHAELAAS